jgi:AcrR family transcriptional regulator
MEDIAKRVKCARATVYNHFPSRDALLEALCSAYLDGYLDIQHRIKAWAQPDSTIFDVLRETIAEELRWRVANGGLRGALDTAKLLRKDYYVEGNQRIDDAMQAWFGEIYAASASLGLARPELDIAFATKAIYGMVDSVVAGFPVNIPSRAVARAADQLARLQWYALYATPPDDAPLFSVLGIARDQPGDRAGSAADRLGIAS